MIKIGKSIHELDLLAATFYTEVVKNLDIENILNVRVKRATRMASFAEATFYAYLYTNLKKIITSIPSELEKLYININPLYTALEASRVNTLPTPKTNKQISDTKKALKDEVLSIFDYNSFTNYENGNWAYNHSKKIGQNVCPYCNSQYTFTIKTPRGKTRPHFDHFFKKSKYPAYSVKTEQVIPGKVNTL
ncbi:hypothetical protein [Cesiribacter sp. SM1]|uniref:hypothetical protein n=1 Tax=Cesiribacter sp. SM1 TaxID=2861196 RepID=UPI001CD69BFB|nr:hypothetical protein [Cesiribacter sp. SM1]